MYAVAQHVWSRRSGREGVNCCLYLHEGSRMDWTSPDVWTAIDRHPGRFLEQRNDVDPPGGNEVRSYLDLVAPDDGAIEPIRQALDLVAIDVSAEGGAVVRSAFGIGVRFDICELRLRGHERAEFNRLKERLLSFLADRSPPGS